MMKRRDWFLMAISVACGLDNPRLTVCVGLVWLLATLLNCIIDDWKAGRFKGY